MTSLKLRGIRTLFILYWFLLAYIIAALIWWFIALNNQNNIIALLKLEQVNTRGNIQAESNKILNEKSRRTAQYIGEGVTFLLLTLAGALFVFRAVRRELKLSRQQQNFMMAITHELRTPITISKLNLETLQKRHLAEDVQKKLIANTLQEANRLNDLSNNLLLAGQFEAGGYNVAREELNLSDLVQHSVNDYQSRFPLRIIHSECEKDIYLVGDKLLLQMAINNLIDNALKYSPEDKPVEVRLSGKKGKISLAIKDEGKGIPKPEKQKVFNKFYRLGNEHTKGAKGTGLGLFLTHKIAAQHKGTITISDNLPKGSVFIVDLPEYKKESNG